MHAVNRLELVTGVKVVPVIAVRAVWVTEVKAVLAIAARVLWVIVVKVDPVIGVKVDPVIVLRQERVTGQGVPGKAAVAGQAGLTHARHSIRVNHARVHRRPAIVVHQVAHR
jgi:hypothetical protein